jgi:FXSXX-COOH protein
MEATLEMVMKTPLGQIDVDAMSAIMRRVLDEEEVEVLDVAAFNSSI